MNALPPALLMDSGPLQLSCHPVPSDTALFGSTVAQLDHVHIADTELQPADWRPLLDWMERHQVSLLSCRLPQSNIRESLFLQGLGFCFIETVLRPNFQHLQQAPTHRPSEPQQALTIQAAETADLPALEAIAASAFSNQRHHLDPRLDSAIANQRYINWVRSSIKQPQQQLLKLLDDDRLIGFFIIETNNTQAYWQLNAVAPHYQGHGYGKRSWSAMLDWHRRRGITSVSTRVSAANQRALNLYAQFGARFLATEITLHWVRQH